MSRSSKLFLSSRRYYYLVHSQNIFPIMYSIWIGLIWFMVFNATFNNISVISLFHMEAEHSFRISKCIEVNNNCQISSVLLSSGNISKSNLIFVGLCYNIIHDISEKGEENNDFILIRMWCLACDQKTIILTTLSLIPLLYMFVWLFDSV